MLDLVWYKDVAPTEELMRYPSKSLFNKFSMLFDTNTVAGCLLRIE